MGNEVIISMSIVIYVESVSIPVNLIISVCRISFWGRLFTI